MSNILHITSGDMAGSGLEKSGVGGEVFVWHDILYDGPRRPGWQDDGILEARSGFIEDATGKGLARELVLRTLRHQYTKLTEAAGCERTVLWFDACLFDQAMLCHILACMRLKKINNVELICLDKFPGITPFHGLGQLKPAQFLSVYNQRHPVTEEQFLFAEKADRAFAVQDRNAFIELSNYTDAPLPWIPAAVARWLEEQPDGPDGLGRLEKLALEAIRKGTRLPGEIFREVSAADTPPQFWGDTTLWAKVNSLADRNLVLIEGPERRLPQWEGKTELKLFRISAI